MTVAPAVSSPAPAQFWRWLGAMLLVFLIADYDVSWLAAILSGLRLFSGSFPAEFGFVFAVALFYTRPGFVYSLVFFFNLFVLQGLDRPVGVRAWPRVVAGIAALLAAQVASAALAFFLGFFVFAAGASLRGETMPAALLLALAAAMAGALSAGVLGLVHRYGSAETGQARGLMRAHLSGGAIAGVVLIVSPFMLGPSLINAGRLTSNQWLLLGGEKALMLVAFVPHAILTWRAMRPVLAERTDTQRPTTAFWMRLAAVTLALLVLAVVLALFVRQGL